jgi:hypothetical protein
MSINIEPVFANSWVLGMVRLNTGNTASNGSGSITKVVTGATNGTRIDKITFINSQLIATGSTAMTGKVFLSNNGGSTWFFYNEIAIATATRSTAVIGAKNIMITGGLFLPSGVILGVAQSVYAGAKDQQDVIVEGGNF